MLNALEKAGLHAMITCHVIPDIASTIIEYYDEKYYKLLVDCEVRTQYPHSFEIYINLNSHTLRKIREVLKEQRIEDIINGNVDDHLDYHNHRDDYDQSDHDYYNQRPEFFQDPECHIPDECNINVLSMSIAEINPSISYDDKFYILQHLLAIYEKYLATEEDKVEQESLKHLANKEIDELHKMNLDYLEHSLRIIAIYEKYWEMGLITFERSDVQSFTRQRYKI